MITANNFGAAAADINVNALQTYDFLLLHGTIVVNTSAAAYQAAEALELTLEGALLPNSVPSAAYITAVSNGNKVVTVAKAQLVNQTTLRIEKVAAWSKFSTYTIRLQCIFFAPGREIEPKRNSAESISLSNPPSGITLNFGVVMQFAGMVAFFARFSAFATAEPNTPIELTVSLLNNVPVIPVLLVYNDPTLEEDGSGYVEATIGNGKICVPNGLPALANNATGFKFIKGFYIPEE